MATSTFIVTGMTCGHCVASVSEELRKVDGVADVTVDLATGEVTVASDRELDQQQVREAVAEAGYALAE